MCGDTIPGPSEGCFQDAWEMNTSALLDRVAQLNKTDGGDAPSPGTPTSVTSPAVTPVTSPMVVTPPALSPSVSKKNPKEDRMAALEEAAVHVFDNYYSKAFPPVPPGKSNAWYVSIFGDSTFRFG